MPLLYIKRIENMKNPMNPMIKIILSAVVFCSRDSSGCRPLKVIACVRVPTWICTLMFQASTINLLVVAIRIPMFALLACAIRFGMTLIPTVDTIRELFDKTSSHLVEILIRGVRVKVHVTL